MTNLFARTRSFTDRARWLTPLVHNAGSAASFLVKAKIRPDYIGKGAYQALPLHFRGCDISALREVFIDAEYNFLTPLLQNIKNPNILDIGAHIGTFSLWVLNVNPNADILSIEADPNTYKVLIQNIESNNTYNWQAINHAAWKNNDTISFSDVGDSMSHRVKSTGSKKVSGITLQDVIAKMDDRQIDLAKIDIEGAEEAFICQHPDLLTKIDNLVIELHPGRCDTDRVDALLREKYSTVKEIPDRISSKPLLYCQNHNNP